MKSKIKYIFLSLFLTIALSPRLYADETEKPKDEVKVTDTKIKLSFDTLDGAKLIKATVTGKDASGAEVPVKDVTVKILIKKSFGSLPVEGDNMATDETGTVTVEFPKAMPGDKDGNVTVLAKVEDNPKVGDLETEAISKFGVATHIENILNKRALWAARASAPISLVITVNALLALVWGTILYILFKLITINRLGKNEKVVKS
jgi:hypothetical protein